MRHSLKYGIRFLLISLLLLSIFFVTSPVQAVPTIFPAVLPGAQVGVPYTATLTAAPLACPCTWAITSGSLPPGLTLGATTGTISGTPSTAGPYTFFVTVTDTTGTSPQQGFSIVVAEKPLAFVYTYLPEATEGVSYQGDIRVTGGKAPYTFSLVSGTLPLWLTLDPVNGIISGIPAKGTAGRHVFTIGVTDSSTPPLSAQQSFSLVVRKGFYETIITIASNLVAGETNVFVGGAQVAKLRGGESKSFTFPVGTKQTITVDPVVPHPTKPDVRFKPEVEKIVVDELAPNAHFSYFAEYYVELKTDPPQIATLAGSNWYKEGTTLKSSASAKIEGTPGTEYRFSYWLLPNGEKIKGEDLSRIVTEPGRVIATYDTYYQLTVTSSHGKVDGSGWHKAGTMAKWSLTPPEVPMSGILSFFRGKLKPDNPGGTEVMDAPKTITVTWKPDYTMPLILIPSLLLALSFATFGLYRLWRGPRPVPVPPPAPAPEPLPPPPPTVVMIEREGPKTLPEATREQLLEKFRELLQKYEEEIKAGIEVKELPGGEVVEEGKRLPPPPSPVVEAETVLEEKRLARPCGHVSKKLLRTVASNWREIERRTAGLPASGEAAEVKGVSFVVVWARDIYNEWEILTCSLPRRHQEPHEGILSLTYTLLNTVTEEKVYSPRQKVKPPKPHFTDGLPIVDLAPERVIAADRLPPDTHQ